jgi:hypothetical protein
MDIAMVALGPMKKKRSGKMRLLKKNWKLENLKAIQARMSGWQLETFKESYKYKSIHGISLFKKDLQSKS